MDGTITVNIVLRPGICSLVVVDHLNHQQQIVFSHLLHVLSQLLHINLHPEGSFSIGLHRHRYMLKGLLKLTPLSGLFFFFADSSRALTPFASPGTGPDSFKMERRAGFGFLKTYKQYRLRFTLSSRAGSVETHNRVFRLIMLTLEI